MQRFFNSLDDRLFKTIFQPAADYVTMQYGFARTRLACLCSDMSAAAWIIANLHGLSGAATHGETAALCFNTVMLLLGLAALTGLRTIFARLPGTGTNPLRVTMRPHRAVILLMIITRAMILQTLDMSTLSEFGMLGLAAASLYFGACAACPPGQRLPRLQTSRTFT